MGAFHRHRSSYLKFSSYDTDCCMKRILDEIFLSISIPISILIYIYIQYFFFSLSILIFSTFPSAFPPIHLSIYPFIWGGLFFFFLEISCPLIAEHCLYSIISQITTISLSGYLPIYLSMHLSSHFNCRRISIKKACRFDKWLETAKRLKIH